MDENVRCPEGFDLDTKAYYLLNERVFDLVTCSSNSVVAPINRSLKKLGAYIRLYYHMIWVYKEYIDENPDFTETVYRIEIFRRKIQEQIDECDHPLDNGIRLSLLRDAHTITFMGNRIIEIYDSARDWCLSREMSCKTERLRKIYRVLDAEEELFFGYPKTRLCYEETVKPYINAALHSRNAAPAKSVTMEMVERFRVVVNDSLPQINGKPVPFAEQPTSPT